VIVTVTLNPAWDVTYGLGELRLGEVNRVGTVLERPGGKGVNVARVLHALGADVLVTGFSGGPGGRRLESALTDLGLPNDFVDALPDVRRTLVVHDDNGCTTSLWEPGSPPGDPAAAADALLARVDRMLPATRALVISGSQPAGVDPLLPARLAAAAAARGVPVVADVSGDALRHAAAGGHAILMPNRDELAQLIGRALPDVAAVEHGAGALAQLGAPAVVATAGPDGALLHSEGRTWRARPVERVTGNPTGAGDAAAAAIARGLASDAGWPTLLADAVALSAAAVRRPVAGEVDLDAYRRWRHAVTVERLAPSPTGAPERKEGPT
jgi:1-phosphofructokinase family hexose kinase